MSSAVMTYTPVYNNSKGIDGNDKHFVSQKIYYSNISWPCYSFSFLTMCRGR